MVDCFIEYSNEFSVKIGSTGTRCKLHRAPLGCDLKGDLNPGYAANQSKHCRIDLNLGVLPEHCWTEVVLQAKGGPTQN